MSIAGILAFLGSGLGRWAAAALVAVALLGGAYLKGKGDGAAKAEAVCAAAMAAERLAAAKALEVERSHQAAAAAAAVEAATGRAEAAEAAAEALQKQVDDLTEDVRRRPVGSVCTVGEGDAKTLNAIR